MPFWRNRDRERFIGSYDPEHEMPDPDRHARERYESDAYRHNASDSRYGYRWNPDRFENRFPGRHRDDVARDREWNRDARDRFYQDRYAQTRMGRDEQRAGYGSLPRDYERGGQWDRGWDYDRDRSREMSGIDRYRGPRNDYGRYGGDRDYGTSFGSDRAYGPDRNYGGNRNYDNNRDYDHDRGYDRDRDLGGRSMPDWDREARSDRDRDYGWEDVGDISYDRNRGRRY